MQQKCKLLCEEGGTRFFYSLVAEWQIRGKYSSQPSRKRNYPQGYPLRDGSVVSQQDVRVDKSPAQCNQGC